MNTHNYVEEIFKEYENNKTLADFKEEIESNLKDRIAYLQAKGISADDAQEKAKNELGNISEIAEQISLRKKREVFEQMYMKTRNYISAKKMLLYVTFGFLVALGLVLSACAYFYSNDAVAGIASLIPLVMLPICALFFMILTQETARSYPMNRKRAFFYTVTAGIFIFGIIIFVMMFFVKEANITDALGTLIPFALPGAAILVFLACTEKERRKPWAIGETNVFAETSNAKYGDPKFSIRRRLLSGALWMFACSLFITLGIAIGFKYSWVVFLFAVSGEIVIECFMIFPATEKNKT